LSNHLGNVLVTISDKKIGVNDGTYDAGGVKLNSTPDDKIDFYTADVVTANDYYPFGMAMPGRKFATTNQYRYGFNGKENDNEVKGDGNEQDYGMRIYDPRLGKFLSFDPLSWRYPMLTPYQFASNMPTKFVVANFLPGINIPNG
jgi:RHS repeat-associated protein